MGKSAIAIFNVDPRDFKIKKSFNWTKNKNIKGYVLFQQESKDSPVDVQVNVEGLPNGLHGMHVHEKKLTQSILNYNDCCNRLGGHFNPTNDVHGMHVGDLCFNIESKKKKVDKCFTDYNISLYGKTFNIIDRSLIIHKDEDDMGIANPNGPINEESLITGNAGARIACSNIMEM